MSAVFVGTPAEAQAAIEDAAGKLDGQFAELRSVLEGALARTLIDPVRLEDRMARALELLRAQVLDLAEQFRLAPRDHAEVLLKLDGLAETVAETRHDYRMRLRDEGAVEPDQI